MRNDFAKILRNTFCISRNRVISFAKEISSNTYFALQNDFAEISQNTLYFAKFCHVISSVKEISQIFVKYLFRQMILLKFLCKTSFAKRNFAKLRKILLYEILRNETIAKFCAISFRQIFVATLAFTVLKNPR